MKLKTKSKRNSKQVNKPTNNQKEQKPLIHHNSAITLRDIVYGYRENLPILKRVRFAIKRGDYVCIIGPNGSGKSTVSKVIAGLYRPWRGKIFLYNEMIHQSNYELLINSVGIIFQNPDNQFIGLTVEDDIAFGLENRQIFPYLMKEKILTAAKKVEIIDLLKFEASRLSGGQKQRVAIASILAIDPDIIIFDESTSMLDPRAKNEIKNLMIELRDKYQKTIISITHDMDEVINANCAIVMANGSTLRYGDPHRVLTDEKFLKSVALDMPFVLELAKKLNDYDKKIHLTLNMDDLIKNIVRVV